MSDAIVNALSDEDNEISDVIDEIQGPIKANQFLRCRILKTFCIIFFNMKGTLQCF